jgi:hypothetical protein
LWTVTVIPREPFVDVFAVTAATVVAAATCDTVTDAPPDPPVDTVTVVDPAVPGAVAVQHVHHAEPDAAGVTCRVHTIPCVSEHDGEVP